MVAEGGGADVNQDSRARPPAAARRRIWLCADDYGISESVSAGIRDLVMRHRLNATSAMVVARSLHRSEAQSLKILNAGGRRVAIGLHLTLTAPFRPLTQGFSPLVGGAFPPIGRMMLRALTGRLEVAPIAAEVEAQLRAFASLFGQPPDFVDGHQHVHILPQVREAVLGTVARTLPYAWVRQCGRAAPLMRQLGDRKGLVLSLLSRGFRRRARALGVAVNPAFAGTYDFGPEADFAALLPRFLADLPDGGVIMCHPGFVDAELERLDPLTTLREREHAYLAGDAFPAALAAAGATLA